MKILAGGSATCLVTCPIPLIGHPYVLSSAGSLPAKNTLTGCPSRGLEPRRPAVTRGVPGMSRECPLSRHGVVRAHDVPDDLGMFVTVERRDAAGRGVSLETLAAAACFASMVGLIALAGAGTAAPPVTALVWGWPVCAIAGGVLLDMRPGNRTARALVALGAMPFLILGWATLRSGGRPHTTEVAGYTWEIAAPLGCAVCLGIALAARPLTRSVARLAGAGALGAALVAVIATGTAS